MGDADDEKQLVRSFLGRPILAAERDLQLLERVRAHPRLCSVLDLLRSEADDSRPFIKLGAPREESRVALLDDVLALLSPGDADAEKADVK